jgi:hypothetical protein
MLLKSIEHNNIIKLYGYSVDDDNGGKFFVVTGFILF